MQPGFLEQITGFNSGYIFKLSALHYFCGIYAWNEINSLLNAENFHLIHPVATDTKKNHADHFLCHHFIQPAIYVHISAHSTMLLLTCF